MAEHKGRKRTNGENYMIRSFTIYTFPKTFIVEKSKRDGMGRACGKQGTAYKCTQNLVAEPEAKRRHAKFRHTDGKKILNGGSRIGPAKGSCEYGTEHLGSTTGVELLDELSDHQLLKRTLGHAVIW